MKGIKKPMKVAAGLALTFITMVGTYNAIMINSHSFINSSDAPSIKRLDEVYGVVKIGRTLAATAHWQKLPAAPASQTKLKENKPAFVAADPVETSKTPAMAAIQEEINLNLTDVVNPKKWQKGLNPSQFSGSIVSNYGVIETLNVSLPGGEGVSVSFAEISGNVFEYDMNGELYSGMLYQVDQNSYVVSLTNGPLEGTRLHFSADPMNDQFQAEESRQYLAEKHQVEIGNFGDGQVFEAENTQTAQTGGQPQTFQF